MIVDKNGDAHRSRHDVPINTEPGNYRGIIVAATPLVERKQYHIVVDVEVRGSVSHYELRFTAETRTENLRRWRRATMSCCRCSRCSVRVINGDARRITN